MTALIAETSRSQLGDAVVKSVYWFADAHADQNDTMRFTKLWSCAESFFSLEKDRVTKLNVSGIASVLVFSGFQAVEVKDYRAVKKRLAALYDLRSRALHRAEYDEITAGDIDELSHWIAWVIISMVLFIERGYRTLVQIKEQCARLRLPGVTASAKHGKGAVIGPTGNTISMVYAVTKKCIGM